MQSNPSAESTFFILLLTPTLSFYHSMKVKILLFAKAREIVGASEIAVDIEGQTTTHEALIAFLGNTAYPALKPVLSSCILAINQEYSTNLTDIIRETDEVALIPPISGG